MSYARMQETEQRLEHEVQALLAEAGAVDAAEDATYGRDRCGDELPAELARRESRLAKIREAKAALEAEAKARARVAAAEVAAKLAAREQRVGRGKGRRAKMPDPEQAAPAAKAQRNFTDPESRIMIDGATKSFLQAYNAQAAVDGHAQVIVACDVTPTAADAEQFGPLLEQVQAHLCAAPQVLSADAGYFSEANCRDGRLGGRGRVRPSRRAGASSIGDGGHAAPGTQECGRRTDARQASRPRRGGALRPPENNPRARLWADQGGP
jgi:hypothetical protein